MSISDMEEGYRIQKEYDERFRRANMGAWEPSNTNRLRLLQDRECKMGVYIDAELGEIDVVYRLREHRPNETVRDIRQEYLELVDKYCALVVEYSNRMEELIEAKKGLNERKQNP